MKGVFSVPPEKLDALKAVVNHIKESPTVPARQVASVIGKIISMSLGLGPIAPLMTRSLYTSLKSVDLAQTVCSEICLLRC